MFGPVKRSEFECHMLALLDEFQRAEEKASSTYDLSYSDFIPEGWWDRLAQVMDDAVR